MGVCVGVSVGDGVSVGRGVKVSGSVGTRVKVSVPCGDDMKEMLVDVEAGIGESEAAGVPPVLLKLQANVVNNRMAGRRRFKLFMA